MNKFGYVNEIFARRSSFRQNIFISLMFKYLNQWMDFIGTEYHVNIKTFLKFLGGKRFTFIRNLSFTGAYLRLNLLNLINYAWQDDARKSMIFHFVPTICLCLSIDRRNDLFVCSFFFCRFLHIFNYMNQRYLQSICSDARKLKGIKEEIWYSMECFDQYNRVPINLLEHLDIRKIRTKHTSFKLIVEISKGSSVRWLKIESTWILFWKWGIEMRIRMGYCQ